ncbi:MAG: FAD-dependent oxidoreductase [Pirellulales bacterium]
MVPASYLLLVAVALTSSQSQRYDVVVYGGTSAGVAAAVQAARLGKSVVLIEPARHLGGLTSGGLGATDIGNKGAIGGLSRDFYRRVGKHYGTDEAWTFEPHVAEQVMNELVREACVKVVFGERLDLANAVKKNGGHITAISMESGREFAGRVFIDAGYEGDLMAKAGVSYHVGREANFVYGETFNGVQLGSKKHQFRVAVDPYVTPGDPASGLLPGIHSGVAGQHGEGDRRVQAYNFRMCLTDDPANRLPFPKPPGYDPLRYELLRRYIAAGVFDALGSNLPMPNRKTDTNNNGAFSTDNIGMNYDYPDGDYATRERIFHEHVTYQQGLMWFLANDPRLPERVRKEVNRWGLCKDEFQETGGWPHQLYVREARRMISDAVMTQHHCQGRKVADDSIGLAAYGMDSHNTQRWVKDGYATNEGDVQVHGFRPYPIAYGSIVPKRDECQNLLVPVCLSASHIAYGSIRMEPVFMVLGQSAATAACQAIDAGAEVQEIDLAKLKEKLLADKQILAWDEPAAHPAIDPSKLPGKVLDDTEAERTGDWTESAATGSFIGVGYLHDGNADKGRKALRFKFAVERSGRYEVRLAYTAHPNRATKVPVTIVAAGKESVVTIDQRRPPNAIALPNIEGRFAPLGQFDLKEGDTVSITISNRDTDGYVVVDAVQMIAIQ